MEASFDLKSKAARFLGVSVLLRPGILCFVVLAGGGWTAALWGGALAAPACAETSGRVGEVVHFSPGDERRRCTPLPAGASSDLSARTGIALLRATGLPVVTKPYGSMGEFVCKIRGVGSDAADCPAKDGSYWAYYHLSVKGVWRVSNLGASAYLVHDKDVEGWSWQPGGKQTLPGRATLSAICAQGASPFVETYRRAGATYLGYLALGLVGLSLAGITFVLVKRTGG